MTAADIPVPKGMRYDERRQFLLPQGLVARHLPSHPLFPRPKRTSQAVAFDEMSGNTTLGVHMSQVAPGGMKPGHRHLDEAVFYIVSGHGWSELKQSDDAPVQRVDWKAGDMLSIPANAWHQHFNGSADEPALQLAFKNTRLLRKLFGSRDFVYANEFRLADRYNDEDDYWDSRTELADGYIAQNRIADVANVPLRDAPDAGRLVSMEKYRMGGHLMLDVVAVELGRKGHVKAHRHLVEEALLAVKGHFRTLIWHENGREELIEWGEGDILFPPLNSWHQHFARGHEPVRYVAVRNVFLNRAFGLDDHEMGTVLPDRYPDVLEPDLDRDLPPRA
ncbi:MAG: cupin domain-containing protein [Acidimicrobiia bacterium]|nr:cupin domain-containing protein [Acidimicrobiia bacterium]MDH5504642.1 cupin domain-containing protein [Acidimicrobiia bacterium]